MHHAKRRGMTKNARKRKEKKEKDSSFKPLHFWSLPIFHPSSYSWWFSCGMVMPDWLLTPNAWWGVFGPCPSLGGQVAILTQGSSGILSGDLLMKQAKLASLTGRLRSQLGLQWKSPKQFRVLIIWFANLNRLGCVCTQDQDDVRNMLTGTGMDATWKVRNT